MSSRVTIPIVSLGLLLAAAACNKSQASSAPAEQAPVAAATAADNVAPVEDFRGEAEKMFRSRCIVCHGEKGTGDGPGAAALNPKPRNYTDAAWQASVTDEQIKNTIVNGGAAVGKSPIMPGSPDLQSKPEVVDELVKIIRKFKTAT